ncbi:MAG: prolipoprotein diacylglyceryl transferase [Elusimicrobiaceae bacterium]|nr:prolipoprotein diacylglyceryl transferase [Elusimicrobiaceae bacterium]
MHPELFNLGPVHIASYGVMTLIGYTAAIWYAHANLVRMQLDADRFWNLVTAIIIGALLGGKLLYVAIYWHGMGADFSGRLREALTGIRYGFVFYGGLLGALGLSWWYARRAKIRFWQTADCFGPAIALGHAFGRIGCFLAGCCYGRIAPRWAGVSFSDPQCLVPASLLGVPLYPVQLFESAANFALFAVLHRLLTKKSAGYGKYGIVMLGYAGGYAVIRFITEFFRGDDRGGALLGLSPSQLLALSAAAAIAAVYRVLPERKPGRPAGKD